MTTPFDTLTSAVTSARSQFSIISGTQEDNAELIKELSKAFIGAISDLVHAAGGDNDYLEPWVDGIANDIDLAFQSARDPMVTPVFKSRPGLLKLIVQGADMRGSR